MWFVREAVPGWLTTTYTFTNRRLIKRSGSHQAKHDIPLNRISDVDYEKGLIDRMLGCGTLVVSDASEQGGRAAGHPARRGGPAVVTDELHHRADRPRQAMTAT